MIEACQYIVTAAGVSEKALCETHVFEHSAGLGGTATVVHDIESFVQVGCGVRD